MGTHPRGDIRDFPLNFSPFRCHFWSAFPKKKVFPCTPKISLHIFQKKCHFEKKCRQNFFSVPLLRRISPKKVLSLHTQNFLAHFSKKVPLWKKVAHPKFPCTFSKKVPLWKIVPLWKNIDYNASSTKSTTMLVVLNHHLKIFWRSTSTIVYDRKFSHWSLLVNRNGINNETKTVIYNYIHDKNFILMFLIVNRITSLLNISPELKS